MFLKLHQTCTKLYTVFVALVIHTNSISVGMSQGFSAVLIPQLESSSLIQIDSEDASWIASLGVISTPGGALLSGILAEAIGRKTTLQVTAIPFLFGWILMALAQEKIMIYAGRFITGFAIGMAATSYVYLAEIGLPSERGMLAALGPVFVSFGVLLVYCFGYFMDWHLACIVCAGVAAFSLIGIYILPETPAWLASQGKYEKAQSTLLSLRKSHEIADKEMTQVLQSIHKEKKTLLQYFKQFKEPEVWKPFLILIFFFIFQEGSGMYTLVYYTTNIFQNIGPVFDSSVESIIVGGVRLFTSAVGSVCIQNFGRRPLAMLSGLGMGLTMGIAAFYDYTYGHLSMEERPFSYLPFLCFIINVVASMLGMLQLPWLMIGELFPLSVRGAMSGLVSSLAYLFIFAIIKIYPNLMLLKMWGMMGIFSVVSLLSVIFVYFYLPETQGKLLIEIEDSFKSKKEPIKDPVYILRIP